MSELRLHPRISTQLQAQVCNDHQDSASARIRNLSPGGLMLEADLSLKELIFKGYEHEKDPLFHPVELDIQIQLTGQSELFHSRARVLYIRRLSQSSFELGLRYVAISAAAARMMEQHVFGSNTQEPQLAVS